MRNLIDEKKRKVIVAGLKMGGNKLNYSSSNIFLPEHVGFIKYINKRFTLNYILDSEGIKENVFSKTIGKSIFEIKYSDLQIGGIKPSMILVEDGRFYLDFLQNPEYSSQNRFSEFENKIKGSGNLEDFFSNFTFS